MKTVFSQKKQIKLANKLEDLDFDFRADTVKIESMGDLEDKLYAPFSRSEQIFYRGERLSSIMRPLLPSIYRNKEILFEHSNKVDLVTSQELYNFYKNKSGFFDLYEQIIEPVSTDNMYNFLAFSQHYFGISPLIDFTKSLDVALSFALKGRTSVDKDILIYTLQLKSEEEYTASIDTANEWIRDYSVILFRDITGIDFQSPLDAISDYRIISQHIKGHSLLELNAPSAKLIDVPTNDLIKYQQGVFLLLDDFSLMHKSYLTKKIRDDFLMKKWLISRELCPDIAKWLKETAPHYAYENITDLSNVVREIKKNNPLIYGMN